MKKLLILGLALVLSAGSAGAQKHDIVDTAVAAGSFKTLAAALGAADLVDALKGKGPFTVFAPTDAAFAKLPEGVVASLLEPKNKGRLTEILTFHVVSGRLPAAEVLKQKGLVTLAGQRADLAVTDAGATIDGARIVKTDIACSNGIIHVIDTVILPSEKNIVTTAVEAGSFKTLAAALGAGGLVEALQGKGPFTVFAPTDAAFAKLPKGTVETLLRPENKAKLVEILTYHVVPGRYHSEAVVGTPKLASLEGREIRFSLKDGKAYANDATIVATDIDASNGVIHVIDSVIMPPAPAPIETGKMEKLLKRAIDRGVPLYNSGNHEACAAVYAFCAEALMEMPKSEVDAHSRRALAKAMRSMKHEHDAGRQAWIMREAFDAMLATSRTTASR